jgi:hypothetical protein
MSYRRNERKGTSQRTAALQGGGALAAVALRLRTWLLPAAVALLVASHLIPSESVAESGTHAVLCMAWCVLLAAWGLTAALAPDAKLYFTASDAAFMLLVALHAASGLVPRDGVVTRQAWNVLWLWVSYGIACFLLRQLLIGASHTGAVLAVMLGLAVALAAHGYYQYFVTGPMVRADYQRHPEQVLRENGIPTEPDSPVRRHFENRLLAVEPLATFALANSLAGFLAPWTVFSAGLAFQLWRRRLPRLVWLTLGAVPLFLIGCLLLTKSRTAVLALVAGGILLGLFGPPMRWHLDWRIPAWIAAALIVLSLVAVGVGGLDIEVLSEAPKSVLYRLEYWRSTAAMIGDHPLLGCGPGNFQDYYAHYKLPQASETVADPHNIFLEIWATAGTPALMAFLAWIGLLGFDLGRSDGPRQLLEPDFPADDPTWGAGDLVPWGALAGVAIGFGLALVTDFPLWTKASGGHVGILLIGLPLAAITIWMLRLWQATGPVTTSIPVIALITLGINLCAAGAAAFPGVILSGLVLAACARQTAAHVHARPIPGAIRGLLVVAPALLALACYWTEYAPVLRCQTLVAEAEKLLEGGSSQPGRVPQAFDHLYAAAQADPSESRVWQRLAAMHLHAWLIGDDETSLEAFGEAAARYAALRPASQRAHAQRGEWFLLAYRKSGQRKHLDAAIEAYQLAVQRSPASALAHAQLAWVHHLAGDASHARPEAARALELDARHSHEELKLGSLRLVDPQPDPEAPSGWRIESGQSAEQLMQSLRNAQSPAGG